MDRKERTASSWSLSESIKSRATDPTAPAAAAASSSSDSPRCNAFNRYSYLKFTAHFNPSACRTACGIHAAPIVPPHSFFFTLFYSLSDLVVVAMPRWSALLVFVNGLEFFVYCERLLKMLEFFA